GRPTSDPTSAPGPFTRVRTRKPAVNKCKDGVVGHGTMRAGIDGTPRSSARAAAIVSAARNGGFGAARRGRRGARLHDFGRRLAVARLRRVVRRVVPELVDVLAARARLRPDRERTVGSAAAHVVLVLEAFVDGFVAQELHVVVARGLVVEPR